MQEELRWTRESLGHHQETIVELKGSISEKENQLLKAQEALKEKSDELQQKVRRSFVKKTRSSVELGSPCLLQTSVCRAPVDVIKNPIIYNSTRLGAECLNIIWNQQCTLTSLHFPSLKFFTVQ